MAQVITGLDNIPISAASAAYAPTNTADVTAMIDSAVSAKLDASASSSFQPAGNYVSSDDLSAYQTTSGMSAYATTGDLSSKLDVSASSSFITSTSDCMPLSASSDYYSTSNPAGYITGVDLTPYQTTADMSGYLATSSIGVDTADAITSIAGSSIAGGGGGGMVTAIGTSNSGITSINSTGLVDTAALRSADFTSLYIEEPLYISSSGDSAYIGISGDYVSSSELANYQTTAGMSAYLPTSAIGVDTASSLITGINGSALSAGSTYSAGQYVQISGDEISVTGLQPSGSYVSSTDLSAYQTVDGMSAYATTGDLSAKLDASASSSFLTAQAQASWSESASASPSYIVDKPDLVDIVAGPGIVVDNPDGNTLRVSTDSAYEVELYSGTKANAGCASFTLSEYASNFDRLRFYGIGYGNTKVMYECPAPDTSTEAISVCYTYYCRDTDNNPWQMRMGVYTSTNGLDFSIRQSKFLYGGDSALAFGGGNTTQNPPIYRIVGVKRIAGGN